MAKLRRNNVEVIRHNQIEEILSPGLRSKPTGLFDCELNDESLLAMLGSIGVDDVEFSRRRLRNFAEFCRNFAAPWRELAFANNSCSYIVTSLVAHWLKWLARVARNST
jgi:hypothetical protein